jgi:hypothetical protein
MGISLKQHESGWAELNIEDNSIEYRNFEQDSLLFIAQVRDKKLVVDKSLLSLFSERALSTIPLYLVNGRTETLNREAASIYTLNGKNIEVVGRQGLGLIHQTDIKGFEIEDIPLIREANTSDAKKASLLGSGNIYKFGDLLISDGVDSTSAVVNSDIIFDCSISMKKSINFTCVKHLIGCNIQSKDEIRLLNLGKAVNLIDCKLSDLEVDLTNCYSIHRCLFDNCLIKGSPAVVGGGTKFRNCSMEMFRSGTAMLYGTHIKEGE